MCNNDDSRPMPGAPEIVRCYIVCEECLTKFTSDDPPFRDGNRFTCFCGGRVRLEHQLRTSPYDEEMTRR